jgi:peptide/nickel transport system substrate-binding protein
MTHRIHPAAQIDARDHADGKLSRREFLTRSTALGVSAAAAYALIGIAAPAPAQAQATRGGTIRISMETRALKDPRLWDWTEHANFCRGWLDYLTQFNRDGTVTGALCESWSANDDATQYTLNLRQGVSWNNGDPFVAQDLVHSFTRWADTTVEGNSMAARVGALVDEATGQLADGAVVVVDDHTLQLNLNRPDIALMAALSDYPCAIVHPSYEGGDPSENPIGTGAYLPETNQVGVLQVLVRNPDHDYWREGAWLDRIEFIDLGTDQAALLAAADSGDIDLTYRTDANFVDAFDSIGWQRTEVVTANTIAVRFNQRVEPYNNRDVRRAIQMAVSNADVMSVAIGGLGLVGENHHVCPIHPEYAELPEMQQDPAAAMALLTEAGFADYPFELISVDTEWQSSACTAIAAQMRDAGISVERSILPGSTFWNGWLDYPFSATEWGPRPLGVQVLALAYKSGEAWNESGFANAEFDSLLDQALGVADADARREIMVRIQTIMQEEGVVIQPFWRSVFNHSNGRFTNVDVHPFYELALHDIHAVG